ncbi:MAG: peptidase [Firmicutes bacterium]|nr:peptidase [Bacillota bacterium]
MEAYYYNQMSKIHQSAYHAMKEGITALQSSFSVPRLEARELSDIFFKLRLDHPEIFYVTTFTYRFYQDASHVEFFPEYLFDKNKIKEHQQAMEARITKLIRPVQGKPVKEQEQYIHDFIVQNIRYDKLKKPYSHEIIGALGQGVSVCEGISKAVKILCDRLNIWCIIVICDADPDNGVKYRHAWNLLKLDKSYYHLDCTFDNTLTNGHQVSADGTAVGAKNDPNALIRYDYFNLCDEQIYRDHRKSMYPIPAATDNSRFFYKEAKLSFTKQEDVHKRTIQAIKKKKPLIFHWRGGYLTREVLNELLEIIHNAAAEKEVHARIHVNWPQSILKIDFTDAITQDEVITDEADESDDE